MWGQIIYVRYRMISILVTETNETSNDLVHHNSFNGLSGLILNALYKKKFFTYKNAKDDRR